MRSLFGLEGLVEVLGYGSCPEVIMLGVPSWWALFLNFWFEELVLKDHSLGRSSN